MIGNENADNKRDRGRGEEVNGKVKGIEEKKRMDAGDIAYLNSIDIFFYCPNRRQIDSSQFSSTAAHQNKNSMKTTSLYRCDAGAKRRKKTTKNDNTHNNTKQCIYFILFIDAEQFIRQHCLSSFLNVCERIEAN